MCDCYTFHAEITRLKFRVPSLYDLAYNCVANPLLCATVACTQEPLTQILYVNEGILEIPRGWTLIRAWTPRPSVKRSLSIVVGNDLFADNVQLFTTPLVTTEYNMIVVRGTAVALLARTTDIMSAIIRSGSVQIPPSLELPYYISYEIGLCLKYIVDMDSEHPLCMHNQ